MVIIKNDHDKTEQIIQKFVMDLFISTLKLFELCFGQSQYLLPNLFQCLKLLSFLAAASFFQKHFT